MASSSLKTFFVLLLAVGLTAAFTYLMVSNHYQRERVERLRAELARVEADRLFLEEDLRQAQASIRALRDRPSATNPTRSSTKETNSRPVNLQPPRVAVLPPSPVLADGATREDPGLDGFADAPVVPLVVPMPPAGWMHYESVTPSQSRCVVRGTSSLGGWELRGFIVVGTLDLDARVNLGLPSVNILSMLGTNIAARADVQIPVRSLHAEVPTSSSVMDRAVHSTLTDRTNAQIAFRLGELTLRDPAVDARAPLKFDSRGELVIRGVTNWIEMPVSFQRAAQANRLKISGARAFRMTDFRIQPPTPTVRGGPVQVGDEVTVTFDWVVDQVAVAAAR
jgi:hypothetical protein